MQHRLYIAATNQHVGKTTCTLGICKALKERGYQVGYCKPVGQEFVDLGNQMAVDKDALLFAQALQFDLFPQAHSPVILGNGATQSYWDDPGNYSFRRHIDFAMHYFEDESLDWVVCEGTGHPGVGSIVGLSNAKVARLIGARVIMVVQGGIGKTIDEMALGLSLFKQEGIPVEGVIVNKVMPDKIEKVRYYLSKILSAWGIPLLGVLPYDETLMFPLLEMIRSAVKGTAIMNEAFLENRIADIVSGSIVESYDLRKHKNILLVSNALRLPDVLKKIVSLAERQGLSHPDIAGFLITGAEDGHPSVQSNSFCMEFIEKYNVPVIESALDTYGAALRINAIEVKINIQTPWKVARAAELVQEHVSLDHLIATIETRPGKR